MTLAGKSAVVTGGAGGLGAAVVRALLGQGARVDVPVRRPEDFETLGRSAGVPAGARLSGGALDLTDEAGVLTYFETLAQGEGLDILVNVAGGFAGGKPVHETPWSVWQQQLDV